MASSGAMVATYSGIAQQRSVRLIESEDGDFLALSLNPLANILSRYIINPGITPGASVAKLGFTDKSVHARLVGNDPGSPQSHLHVLGQKNRSSSLHNFILQYSQQCFLVSMPNTHTHKWRYIYIWCFQKHGWQYEPLTTTTWSLVLAWPYLSKSIPPRPFLERNRGQEWKLHIRHWLLPSPIVLQQWHCCAH